MEDTSVFFNEVSTVLAGTDAALRLSAICFVALPEPDLDAALARAMMPLCASSGSILLLVFPAISSGAAVLDPASASSIFFIAVDSCPAVSTAFANASS